MVHYLIDCRSLTWAQRMNKTLEHAGIPSATVRTPRNVAKGGCGYSLRVSEKYIPRALSVLREAGYDKSRVVVYRDSEVNA